MRLPAIVLGLLICAPALAAETAVPTASLFFNDDDARKIEALAEKITPEHPDAYGIHLGAVIYYGPGDWTLWLQGRIWSPATDRPDLHVVSVSPGEVNLDWIRSPGAPPQAITLRPYQTFQIATGQVTEGLR